MVRETCGVFAMPRSLIKRQAGLRLIVVARGRYRSSDHVILSSQYHPSVLGSILGIPGSQGGFAGLCADEARLRNLYSCTAPLIDPKRSFREG